jgi:hypothetical protein
MALFSLAVRGYWLGMQRQSESEMISNAFVKKRGINFKKLFLILPLTILLCSMQGCNKEEKIELEDQNREGEKIMAQWRESPKLKGKFHPQYPDDVQVVIHDGGPRISRRRPELVWVRVSGCQGEVFLGNVINKPKKLKTVKQGSMIKFLVPEGGRHPLMVTDKYLIERDNWVIHPCNNCGLTELFDAPSDLTRVVFPNIPKNEIMASFTAMCGMCGGVQVVENKEILMMEGKLPIEEQTKK